MTVGRIHTTDDLTSNAWERRVRADRELVQRVVPHALQPVHAEVVRRSMAATAHGLILTGSTARGRRTEISDLDYHLIGDRIETRDLPAELDLHVLSASELNARVVEGDDFVHWSLRFGKVVLDDGTLLAAVRLIAKRQPWPAVERKCQHAEKSLALASRVVETGDVTGGLEQVRTALSLVTRAYLLSAGVFPMSRAELPEQLAAAGRHEAGQALADCIYTQPSLDALALAISRGQELLSIARRGSSAPNGTQRDHDRENS